MARYIKDFPFSGTPDTLYNAVGQYLSSEGYEYTQYEGETVFKKGKGVTSGPSFFKFSFSSNMVRMETWMKYALLPGVYIGELGTTGIVGSAVKGPWKKRIANVEAILTNYSCQSVGQTQANPQYTNDDTQLLNEDDEGTCILNENKAPINNPTPSSYGETSIFCTNCGTKIPASAVFCSVCGYKRPEVATNVSASSLGNISNSPQTQMPYDAQTTYTAQNNTQYPPSGQPVSKKEFIDKYADPSIKKGIKSSAITCYVCAGINFLVAVALNPVGILDSLILLGLALGMHLGRSKVCAILILILSAIEMIIGIALTGTPSGYLWLIAGIASVVAFSKVDKQYKQFLNR